MKILDPGHNFVLNMTPTRPRLDCEFEKTFWICTNCGWEVRNYTKPIKIRYAYSNKENHHVSMDCPETLIYLIHNS